MKTMKTFNFFFSLLILSLLFGPGSIAENAILPPDSIGYVRIEDAERTISELAGFAQKLEIPDASLIFFRMSLERVLSIPDLSGVDLNSPLCFILFNLKEEKDPWAVGFSLSNPDSCRKAMDKSYKLISEEEEEGIRTYSRQIKIFDTKRFRQASLEERKDFQKFYKETEEKVCLALEGKKAWLTKNPALINSVKDLEISDFGAPLSSAITLTVRPEIILQLIREEYSGKNLSGGDAEDPPSPLSPGFSRKIIESYIDFYLGCARQVKTAALGITINAEGVSLQSLLRAKSESLLAKFLREQKAGRLSLARHLDGDAWMVLAYRMRKQEMLLDAYQKLFSAIARTSGPPSEREEALSPDKIKEIYLKSMEPYFKAVGEEMAFSISSSFPDKPFSMLVLQELKDESEYRSYIRESLLETYKSFGSFYEKMGITYDFSGLQEPRKYRDAEIYSIEIQFNWKQLRQKESVSEEENKIFSGWLAEPMLMEMSIWKGTGITSLSWGGECGTEALLDKLAKGESTFDLKNLAGCEAETNGAIYFSVSNFFLWLKQLMAEVEGESSEGGESKLPDLEKLARLDLPLLICIRIEGEDLKASSRIELENIKTLQEIIGEKREEPEKGKP